MELILGSMIFVGTFVFTWYWVCEKMGWIK